MHMCRGGSEDSSSAPAATPVHDEVLSGFSHTKEKKRKKKEEGPGGGSKEAPSHLDRFQEFRG